MRPRIKPSEIRQARRFTAPLLSDLTDAEKDYRLELLRDGEAAEAQEDERVGQEREQ